MLPTARHRCLHNGKASDVPYMVDEGTAVVSMEPRDVLEAGSSWRLALTGKKCPAGKAVRNPSCRGVAGEITRTGCIVGGGRLAEARKVNLDVPVLLGEGEAPRRDGGRGQLVR